MEERGGEEVKIKHHITEPDKQFISLLFALAHHRNFHKNLFFSHHISTLRCDDRHLWLSCVVYRTDNNFFCLDFVARRDVFILPFNINNPVLFFLCSHSCRKVDIEEIIKSLPGILLKASSAFIQARLKDIIKLGIITANGENSGDQDKKMVKTFQQYLPATNRTYSCVHCRAHLASHDELISKSFQGSQGRAYLFNSV